MPGEPIEPGQNQEENLENFLTEDEKQRLDEARPKMGEVFALPPEERKALLSEKFHGFVITGLIDEETVTAEIDSCANAQTQDEFLKRAEKLAIDYFLVSRKDVDDTVKEALLAERGRTSINDLLNYEISANGQIVKIHLEPSEKPGLRKLKELMLSGLDDLAEIVQNDANVLTVQARSWIVAKHPELVEKLGFTLGETYMWEGRESRDSEMSREEFLKRPWRGGKAKKGE